MRKNQQGSALVAYGVLYAVFSVITAVSLNAPWYVDGLLALLSVSFLSAGLFKLCRATTTLTPKPSVPDGPHINDIRFIITPTTELEDVDDDVGPPRTILFGYNWRLERFAGYGILREPRWGDCYGLVEDSLMSKQYEFYETREAATTDAREAAERLRDYYIRQAALGEKTIEYVKLLDAPALP